MSSIKKDMIFAREEYIEMIKAELMGPGSEFSIPDKEHEFISSNPISRYSVGILFPQGNLMNQDNDEAVSLDEQDGDDEDELTQVEETVTIENKKTEHKYEYDETADENLDEEVNMSSQYMPSSMGITFLARGNTDSIKINITFASYRESKLSEVAIPYNPEKPEEYEVPPELANIIYFDKEKKLMKLHSKITRKEIRDIFEKDTIPVNEFKALQNIAYRLADCCRCSYVRVPHSFSEVLLDFSNSDYIDVDLDLEETDVKIVALRTKLSENLWSVTIMLVNALEESPANSKHCIFQPRLEIGTENNEFVFMESNANVDESYMDEEEKSIELLYRNKKIYCTGLGTSADWVVDENGKGKVWNDFFPETEIPAMDFSLPENDDIRDAELSMKYLSDLDETNMEIKLNSMTKLVDLYKQWVGSLESRVDILDQKHKSSAIRNIDECKQAYKRMYSGIETLRKNENAYKAFMLANRAMFMQRVHVKMQSDVSKSKNCYPDDEQLSEILINMNYYNEDDSNCRWRPFQIAFLLMDVNSIVDDNSDERNIVDLIWFPTGGGKTEAYLGLTAFTIFYRKLAHFEESDGTAVMMRYTLRLLAAQQFTRAATLICACEYIRKDSMRRKSVYPRYPLGKTPITIGLWIGGTHIPNNNTGYNSAKDHLDKLLAVSNHNYVRNEKERHSKFQVLKCPWCGTIMVKDECDKHLVGEWGYAMDKGNHFYMFCPHQDCDFTEKLPIQVIDEELYRNPPTLLFGTVDKFAMLSWDGRTGTFFASNSKNRTPDLIIQDELHLISGSLGTMVGLYETAVDALCSHKGVSPKIIASTATIRRAKEQCSVLYNRQVVQFPAPGLEAEDSFFAKESPVDYEKGLYGRKYIGVMPSGKTKALTEIRMMAALLQKLYTYDLPDSIKDKLWTLTVYFNSLKDLGKAFTMVEDDVKDAIIRTANRMSTGRRMIISADELTSRVSTTELNETLDKLEKTEYSKENIEAKRYASNILLATNMISVGIDVARLNVMLMVGQPKLTSEYIQASSRVGRSYPGVVFMQYDATKSRDRSHYENFKPYHNSLYRFVEPTGATPFSKPARERALHSVLVAMLRQLANLNEEKDAGIFDLEYFKNTIHEIQDFIVNRIEKINMRCSYQVNDDIEDVKHEISEFFQAWQDMINNCKNGTPEAKLYFGRKFMVAPLGENERRLLKPYNSLKKDSGKQTLTSMRNVDSSVSGSLIVWED